jgi:hypothetical protein
MAERERQYLQRHVIVYATSPQNMLQTWHGLTSSWPSAEYQLFPAPPWPLVSLR